MSVPSTFFVMSPLSTKGRDFSEDPALPFHQAGGLADDQIAELEFLLTGVSVEKLLDEDGLRSGLVWEGGEDGPWVYELSSRLVTALAKAPSAKLKSISKTWGGGAFEEPVMMKLLDALKALALEATKTKRKVYWWVSL
jgi:hypothetical protein